MPRSSWFGPAFAILLFATVEAAPSTSGPFASLAGSWSGDGNITMTNGVRERLRCRAVYDVTAAGNYLRLDLRCASDSYNFALAGEAEARDGVVTGSWTESTRSAAGTISGRVGAAGIQVTAAGAGFSANLALSTRGNRQSVTIEPQGTEVSAVAVTLSRR